MHELKLDSASIFLGRPLEVRASSTGKISGFASRYGLQDSYGDIVAAGAFDRTLSEHQSAGTSPLMLWSHDPSRPIGRWERFQSTSEGLIAEGQFNLKTDEGRNAFHHVQAGDLDGLSIGFRVYEGGAEIDKKGHRTLKSIQLAEVSVVAMPAMDKARVIEIRSQRDLHQLLRDHGVADRAAKKMAFGGFAAMDGKTVEQLEVEAKAEATAGNLKHIAAQLQRTLKRL